RKSKQLVRSPQMARRHAEMFGSRTPVHVSRKRSTDVWSKTCEFTQPPRLHGEMTVIGTRGPSPIGTGAPDAAPFAGRFADRYSPGVPGGGVGGTTWSKKPS